MCKNYNVLIYDGRLGEDRGIGKATTIYRIKVNYVTGPWDLTRYIVILDVLHFDPLFSDVHCCLHRVTVL